MSFWELLLLGGEMLSVVALGFLVFFVLDRLFPGFALTLLARPKRSPKKDPVLRCPYCGSGKTECHQVRWEGSEYLSAECLSCHRRFRPTQTEWERIFSPRREASTLPDALDVPPDRLP